MILLGATISNSTIDFVKLTALCLQTAEALPEVAAAAASSPEKKLIFPPDTSAIKEASLILMRDKSGSKPTLVRVSQSVVVGLLNYIITKKIATLSTRLEFRRPCWKKGLLSREQGTSPIPSPIKRV